MSAIVCGARSKRESRSASGSVENWVSFAGLTARSWASSMHCAASGRRWPRPSAASWTCWGSSSDRWPTSRTASRRSSPSLSVRRSGTSRSRRLATDDARRQVGPEGWSPSPTRAGGVFSVHKLAGRASVPYDAGMERTTTRRPRRGGGENASPAGVAPARTETVAPAVEVELLVPGEPPEPSFAARVPPPAPERRRPTTRHAIFFDVENTSHPAHIERVIERLAIDRLGFRTEFVAVGNWRVIGHETARMLARHGAQLVHSAPSTGVRDWSDLRIAVSAGAWLAAARPGDVLEIVSDDRAFDAVGDVAQRSSNGTVLIDNIERTLKARGFARPPGSPRLVTRLRRIKELSVSPTGMITLLGEPERAEPVAAGVAAEVAVPEPSTGRRR